MNLKFIIFALTSLSPALLSAQTEMSVNPSTDLTETWGTARAERYDVAFLLSDSSLIGTEITALSVPFAADEAITGYSLWITRELQLEDGENRPDLLQVSAEVESGFISAVLPEPVTIPEEGCYVGFSFTVSEINDYSKTPVTVSPANQPGEMYVHTSRRYLKWGTQNLSLTPDITITLTGDFHYDAMAVISLPETGSLRNEAATATAVLRNHGLNEINSIDYRIDMNNDVITRHIDFEPSLPTDYFTDVLLPVEFDSDLEAGSYPITFTVTEVNGSRNRSSATDIASNLFIYPYMPERIPLMEEYTGTWCGWCPRGIVGMERMSEVYPGKFVYAAYHRDKDPMNTVEEVATPYTGAPSGYLDRVMEVDPYNGLSSTTVTTALEGIGEAWNERCKSATTGEISATAAWTDNNHEVISINSKAVFVRDYSSPRFRIGYLLTADGLRGEGGAWIQSNYFSGEDSYADTELIEFVEKPTHITDMSYDGVVVMSSPLTGVEESVPSEIKMGVPVNHSFSFHPAEAVNYLGESLPLNFDRLKVIAYIVDTLTGEIINCTQCEITDDAYVDKPTIDNVKVDINNDYIVISGITGKSTVTLHSAAGSLIEYGVGEDEIYIAKPVTSGVYLLTINGKCNKIII
ncbi:MAG: hypothetical protein HDR88_04890 [Bacteroides sp.]|nr:hypothetical protein [Bacteroides sp.]